GLLRDIASRYQISLAGVPVIGDSLRDIQSARSVGARPILVCTGKGERTLNKHAAELVDVPVYKDLAEAAASILS
ncbi:MAG TPA: HAD hydrolase-like protein, partial [Gammaproteobacteria bacterium]|nr:HAD hydrolase-like protein [Gammaproteobacteria bacterium]